MKNIQDKIEEERKSAEDTAKELKDWEKNNKNVKVNPSEEKMNTHYMESLCRLLPLCRKEENLKNIHVCDMYLRDIIGFQGKTNVNQDDYKKIIEEGTKKLEEEIKK